MVNIHFVTTLNLCGGFGEIKSMFVYTVRVYFHTKLSE